MSQPDDGPITRDPPHSPGTPRLEDLDVEFPELTYDISDPEDDEGPVEPPD